MKYQWFDICFEKLKINHIKIHENEDDHIIDYIDKHNDVNAKITL
jgi:hypothetical protein